MSENMENMEVQQPVEEAVAAEIVETPKKKANILGIIGFICGILSMVLCCSAWIQLLFAIAAIVLCAIGMSKGKKENQNVVLAIIGLILGIVSTITGIGETLKALNPDMTIWAVEPATAAILAGGTVGTHLQMGIGDGLIPAILNQEIYEDIYIVSDEEALETAQRLAREEGLMCGISSGTNVAAAIQLAKKLGAGKTVVTVLPDTAERYFSTPLFEE